MPLKKVRMLLRVSSNQQLEADGDLSVQRRIVKEYIQKQEDWMGKHHVGIPIGWHSQWYEYLTKLYDVPKMPTAEERKKFLDWLWDFEFNLYGLPVPTQVIFLNMPTEYAIKLMKNRKNKFTNEEKKDIHERNLEHLKDAYNEALKVSKKYNWYEIKCMKDNRIRTIDDIHEEIFKEIKKFL